MLKEDRPERDFRLDEFGTPVPWSNKELQKVQTQTFESPDNEVAKQTFETKNRLYHIDGTTEELRSAAGHWVPPKVGVSRDQYFLEKAEKVGVKRYGDGGGVSRSSAMAAATVIDADALKEEDLMRKAGRSRAQTLLYSSQVGIIYLATFLLDLVALAALYVLQTPPPAPPPPTEASPPTESAPPTRRMLWWIHQYLSLTPEDDSEADLAADLAVAFSGSSSVSYDRTFFYVGCLCVTLTVIACTIVGVYSVGFRSLTASQQRIFVCLSPFGLQTLYAGWLYADELKTAVSEKDVNRATDRHGIVIILTMIQATFSSIPLFLLCATAIAQSSHPRVLVSVLAGSALSMAYAFFGYACTICSKELRKHAHGRTQLFIGMLAHCLWEVAAITSCLAAAKIGPWRFLCVPVLLLLGYLQLAPAVLGLSNSPEKQTSLSAALLVMSPLACLSSVVDGPLLGFGTHHAEDGTFTAADLDRAVAWRRRFVLFVCAFLSLFVDLLAGGERALETFAKPWGVHHDWDWASKLRTDLDVIEDDLVLTIKDFFRASPWWFTRFFVLIMLFTIDIYASSRAWRVAGYSPIEEDDAFMRLQKTIAWLRDKFNFGRAYSRISPAIEPPTPLQALLNNEVSALAPFGHSYQKSEERLRLHDALDALNRTARDVLDSRLPLPPKPALGASEAALAAYEAQVAEVVAARAEQAAEKAALVARAASQMRDEKQPFDSPPPTADPYVMAERIETETSELLARLHRLSPAEISVAEAAIAKYTPSMDSEEDAEYQRALMAMLRQISIPGLQKRVAQEEVVLKIAANGGTGHHPFRCMPLATSLSNSSMWDEGKPTHLPSGRRIYELSSSATRASHFVSHHWGERGERKAELLREFLCLQPLVIGLALIAAILTALLLPLGCSIVFALPGARQVGIIVIATPLVAFLTSIGWIYASAAGRVALRWTPWAMQDEPIWMETACVDEDKLPALMRANFSSYLQKSDRMIAFVSAKYFSRLWCVYELATFCKKYHGPLRKYLDQDLMLLSVNWQQTRDLFAPPAPLPSDDELAPMLYFRCREAACLRPSDRAQLLADIRREWGSEEAFDTYVRTELPAVYAANKLRYSQAVAVTTMEHLDLAFGD